MKRRMAKIFLVLATMCGGARAGLLVTDMVGKAEIEGKRAVGLLAEVADGTRLSLMEGARMTAVDLASGREYVLRGPGQYLIDNNGPRTLKGAPVEAKALPATNLPNVRVAGGRVAQATLVMRGIKRVNALVPISPIKTAVLTTTPKLRWSPVEGAASYQVRIVDEAGSMIYETTTAEAELQLPSSANLAYGKRYMWRIEALGPQGRFAEAGNQFSVVSESQGRMIAQLRPQEGDGHGRRVLYALQLQEAGAIEEAKSIWKGLSLERPEDELIKAMAE